MELNALAFVDNPMFDIDIIDAWLTSTSARHYFDQIAASDNFCLLAFDDNRLVGYISTEPANHPHRKSTYLEVSNLGVHPDCRRQGIADSLLNACETWAKANGYTRLELTCYSRNSGALAYYQQAGFEPVHVVLEKDLKERKRT